MVLRVVLGLLPLLALTEGDGGVDVRVGDGKEGAGTGAAEEDAGAESGAIDEEPEGDEAGEAALAEARAALTTAETELGVLRAFVAGQIARAREELPEALLAFDPGEGARTEDRLAWLETAQEQAARVAGGVVPGSGADPKPDRAAVREIPSPVPVRNMF